MTFKVIETNWPENIAEKYDVYDVRSHGDVVEFLIYEERDKEWKYVDAQLYKPMK